MKDAHGRILYVGKAKNLRARLRSYFRKEADERPQITFLMRRTADIEFTVTDTEKEALLLENTLIKKHQPRYNLFLKDDKSYPSLRLNVGHSYPGLFVTRQIVKDGSMYFGPYASATALRETVDRLTRHFRLRTCSDHEFANRSRPCLEYQIGRCTAPCVGKISPKDYAAQVQEAKLFLAGRKKELIRTLREKMRRASAEMHYEEAAAHRDLIRYMEETLEKQKMIHHAGKNYDAIGFAAVGQRCVACILMVREGVLCDRRHFIFPSPAGWPAEWLSHFLLQYYGVILDPPPEILLPCEPQDSETLRGILEERRGHAVHLRSPKRGEKSKMVLLAEENAKQWGLTKTKVEIDLTMELQGALQLEIPPHMIECVDISNLQGKEAVGSLVCFEEGRPQKNRYRKFKVHFTQEPNDYLMMFEVLSRRFRRVITAATPEEKMRWSPPDLLLVDGGKGQLSVAQKVLSDLGMHSQAVAAIAKAREGEKADKIYIPGRKNPLALKPNSPLLLYLMRLRDEAHRFGIAYHRRLREKNIEKAV